uniref:ER lumen protein-retaining receptor n=1 Tax=Anopheles culicifacies TaxID=139723 RepID=A0A182LV65_9DIPT
MVSIRFWTLGHLRPRYGAFHLTGYRLLADSFHAFAILYLLFNIWRTKSCFGVSGKTQILYVTVFVTRYADLVTFPETYSVYNVMMKILFISATLITVLLMHSIYRKTYDRENDTFYNEILILPCFVTALFVNYRMEAFEILWSFSIFLEAVAILPQLDLICKTFHVEPWFKCYLLLLGSYRALYIVHWIDRYRQYGLYDPLAFIAGGVQTVLFVLLALRIATLKHRERIVTILFEWDSVLLRSVELLILRPTP